MPRQHQEYLLWLESRSPFQYVALQDLHHPELVRSHQHALQALERWRNAHIQVVTQYVILPARRKFYREKTEEKNLSSQDGQKTDILKRSGSRQVVRGTGGTSLIPLLKTYRENTKRVQNVLASRATTGRETMNVSSSLLQHGKSGEMVIDIVWAARRRWKGFGEAALLLLVVLLCNFFV